MSEATAWLQQHADWPEVHDFFSDIAGPIGWWVLVQVVVLFIGTRRGLRLAWFVSLAALSNTLLKWLWAEPRPYWTSDAITASRATPGFGMPSGHAQGAVALWFGLWLAVGRSATGGRGLWLLLTAVVFIVFTGISRVYYGVHSVSQVLVGFGFGIALTLLLSALLPRIEAALRALSLFARSAISLIGLGVALAAGWLTYSYRAGFVAPAQWQARFEATQTRTGYSGEFGEMGLVHPSSLILVALIAGFVVLALVSSETGHRLARTLRSRAACFAFAVVVNLAVLVGLREAQAGLPLVACWLALQPLVALWLPLRLFGELDDTFFQSSKAGE